MIEKRYVWDEVVALEDHYDCDGEDVSWAEDRVMLTVKREELEEAKAAVREYVHPSIHVIYNIVD